MEKNKKAYTVFAWAALCLLAVLGLLSPQQLPVVLYKGSLVLLAALVGHVSAWASALCPPDKLPC